MIFLRSLMVKVVQLTMIPGKLLPIVQCFHWATSLTKNGDYFEKNTFRFGAGKLQLLKTTIEPSVYFDNFFKGVTPGIRISQAF